MRMITDQIREERRDSTYSDTFYYNPLVHGSRSQLKPARRTLRVLPATETDVPAQAIDLEEL